MRRGTCARLAGVLVLALALAGCAGSHPRATAPPKRIATHEASAAASISASDAALLKAVDSSASFGPQLMEAVTRRQAELEKELDAAPFDAETTVALPGESDAVSLKLPAAPRGNAPWPDRFEPDNSQAKASVLHRGQTQLRTIMGSHDIDWIALPNDEGRGFYYVVADGQFYVETKRRPDDKESESDGSWEQNRYYACTPAGDYDGMGTYSWLKISADRPISYRIAHLSSAPKTIVGVDGPLIDIFADSVIDLDPTGYLIQTGRHATRQQLRELRGALFGSGATESGGSDVTDVWDGHSALQRSYWRWPGSARQPLTFWTLSSRAAGHNLIVAAGRDATWSGPEYAAKRDVYWRLRQYVDGTAIAAKPVIYLYPPRERRVTVRLGYRSQLTSTAPVIDSATHGWTVTAKPSGEIIDAGGRRWPYLFWEGLGLPRFDLSTGAVVRSSDADTFLRRALAERGLTAAESAAFREYWVPRLSASPWVLIHFEGATYERYAPLDVTPKPDVSLRVFMVAKPLSGPVAVAPQHLARPPARRGFTLVEWGGALLP